MPWHRLPCQGGFSQEKVIFLRLRGRLEGVQAISITSSYRLTLTIMISKRKSSCSMSAAMMRCTGESLVLACFP
jgi:hypothetical protein